MNPIIQKAKDLADFVDGGGLGDPVHPMIRAYLAEHFGGRLTFRGCHFTPTRAIPLWKTSSACASPPIGTGGTNQNAAAF